MGCHLFPTRKISRKNLIFGLDLTELLPTAEALLPNLSSTFPRIYPDFGRKGGGGGGGGRGTVSAH